jgi:hypothetical protein
MAGRVHRCMQRSIVRAGSALTSEQVAVLDVGERLEV